MSRTVSPIVSDLGTFDVSAPPERTQRCVLCLCPIAESLQEPGSYRKCRRCDVSWYCEADLDDSKDQESFGDWDKDYYADDKTFELHAARRSGMRAIVARLGRLVPKRGRLLDIGTGLGVLLEAARADGWQAEGIEPSVRAAQWARDHSGAVVHQGYLGVVDLPEASFDVITMVDVLRSVPNPLGFLADARRLLRPGGYLMVREGHRQIAVRSRWSKTKAKAQSKKAKKRGLDYQGFSPRSLVFALQSTGCGQAWVEPSPIFADRSHGDSAWRLPLKRLGWLATEAIYLASARSVVLSPSILAFGQLAPRQHD